MKARPVSHLAATILLVGLATSVVPAEDGIEELARAREVFEKEMAFSTRPIRDRYLSRLESMKRSLGSRGEARAAAAVQDEIDRVNAMNPEPAGVVRFVGVWTIQYTNGATRRYSFSADGSATYDEAGGKPVIPPARAKVALKGNDFIVDWGDGSVERLKISAKNLIIELFSPKTTYPSGQPYARGVGVSASNR